MYATTEKVRAAIDSDIDLLDDAQVEKRLDVLKRRNVAGVI